MKFLLSEMPPLTIRAIAFPAAALLLAALARATGQRLAPRRDDRAPIVLAGLLVVFGFNVATAIGQTLTETSKAAIIAYTMPALTAAFAAVFLSERLGPRGALALAVGMAGLAVLASEDVAALTADPRGPAVMFLAAVSWALGNVVLKSRRWSLTPLALTVWFFVVSGAVCWPLVLWLEPPWRQSWPSAPIAWTMTYHVLGPMVICYVLWAGMVERLPATTAAIATLAAPVVGVLASVLLLGDALTWQKVVALTMVLLSIGLTLYRPAKKPGIG